MLTSPLTKTECREALDLLDHIEKALTPKKDTQQQHRIFLLRTFLRAVTHTASPLYPVQKPDKPLQLPGHHRPLPRP